MLLRGQLSHNWVKYLPIVTKSLNDSPLKKLGYLTPSDITDPYDSISVDKALKAHNLQPKILPSYKEQQMNQVKAEKSSKLKPMDYVFLDFSTDLFTKSYDLSVRLACSCWSKKLQMGGTLICKRPSRPHRAPPHLGLPG